MSLQEAVLEIAQEIEDESKAEDYPKPDTLLSWAKQLRRAVKAAEGQPQQPQTTGLTPFQMSQLGNAQHWQLLKQAKDEFREKRLQEQAKIDEKGLTGMVEIKGGQLDGTFFGLEQVPGGGFVPIDKEVYQLGEDGKLHFHQGQTERMLKELGKNIVENI